MHNHLFREGTHFGMLGHINIIVVVQFVGYNTIVSLFIFIDPRYHFVLAGSNWSLWE